MKRFFSFLFSLVALLPVTAQISDGYYRVQNFKTSRYIILVDNKAKPIPATSTKPDLLALRTMSPFSKVVGDPGSIYYIQHISGNQYNLRSQGADAYAFAGRYLNVRKVPSASTYYAWGSAAGVDVYLYDEDSYEPDGVILTGGDEEYRRWKVLPVDASGDNYFGLTPETTVGGVGYTSLYASFPYSFASSGMKAYAVTRVDGDMAIWQEVSGSVAPSTPLVIACAGTGSSSNRLNILSSGGSAPQTNCLRGVYFNTNEFESSLPIYTTDFHFNAKPYDPNTMRLLGVTSKGKLGFIKSNVQYLPKNRAYLEVPAGSPDEITLVTQAEYDAVIAADVVTVTADDKTKVYGDALPQFTYTVTGTGTLSGQPQLTTTATQSSAVGTYPITVQKGTVTNRQFNGVNGTLTVTKAALSVTARSYTIKQNEPLPAFAYDITGFRLGENSTVLTAQPQLSCNVPADKTPGTYAINVAGAVAQNYDITHTAGTLTILPADPITITANSFERLYGDANPELTYTVSGGTVSGTPVLRCEAVPGSPVGQYAITVEAGTVNYPNLVLVAGQLTVNPATVTVSAGNYSMKQTDPRPEFVPTFSGWKNGETEAVLTVQPVLTTDAPADNTPGEYDVNVSGAEAPNYLFTYQAGKLIILEADQIVVIASDATMTYGDEVPQLSYTIEGDAAIEGQPAITCQATPQSPVGQYTITVERGTITWPNVRFVNGTLTVSKAPLTASVGTYTMVQFDELPDFLVHYEGFRNGDDESVLTVLPTVSCEATPDSAPGVYPIVVTGGEAQNYEVNCQNGQLVITVNVGVAAVRFATPVDIYTLTGRLVRRDATTTAGLPRGVYVVNGRKLVVK